MDLFGPIKRAAKKEIDEVQGTILTSWSEFKKDFFANSAFFVLVGLVVAIIRGYVGQECGVRYKKHRLTIILERIRKDKDKPLEMSFTREYSMWCVVCWDSYPIEMKDGSPHIAERSEDAISGKEKKGNTPPTI